MISKEARLTLIGEAIKNTPFEGISEQELLNSAEQISAYISELVDEYAFRAHMENGMEYHEDELPEKIKLLVKSLRYLCFNKSTKRNPEDDDFDTQIRHVR